MIPRLVVPINARISPNQSNGPIVVRQNLLVPRNLIPANARIRGPLAANRVTSAAGETAAASRRLMVPNLLVPHGARIGATGGNASLVARANVFDEALLGKSSLRNRSISMEWLISLGVHAAVVAAALIVPLFFTQVIDQQQFEITFLAAPQVPGAPPPPPPPGVSASRQVPRKVLPMMAKLTMPIAVPRMVPVPSSASEITAGVPGGVPGGVSGGVPGDVIGGIPGGQIGGVFGGVLGGLAPSAPPQPPVEAPAPSGPLHVGGQVKPPRAIYKPAPKYPILALQAQIEGDVEIDAVIDKDGNIVQARAVNGPRMLFGAALKAVSGWKYEPTYLNGEPYPVELIIHVTFTLS
jgi:protein TonB